MAKASTQLGAEVLWGCQVLRRPMGPGPLHPLGGEGWAPGSPLAGHQFVIWLLHDEAGGRSPARPCPARSLSFCEL